MKITLNPINFNKKISFSAKNSTLKSEDAAQKYSQLNFLQEQLYGVQKRLEQKSEGAKRSNEIISLQEQVDDLLARINFLKASLRTNTKNHDNPIKSQSIQHMLMAQTDNASEIENIKKDVDDFLATASERLRFEPLGRDLVVQILPQEKVVKAKPFDESDRKLVLDEYQAKAVESFKNGNSVMVTAPTGTGKTLIAEHIIDEVLKSGKKVIYTTPLKALCNDKYKQFSALWGDYDENGLLVGKSKVGLATGDVKINPNAPIVVMTTEIYRNMLLQRGEKDVEKELKDVDVVIFDEFHYMGDNQRGSVWEESVMFSPKKIKHLMLSATVANSNDLNNWLNSINNEHGSEVVIVPEEERHVPLKHSVYSKINGTFGLFDLMEEKIDIDELSKKKLCKREKEVLSEIGKVFRSDNGLDILRGNFSYLFNSGSKSVNAQKFINELVKSGVPYQKAEQYALRLSDKKSRKLNSDLSRMQSIEDIPINNLVRELDRKNMTPALYFVYSKKNCKKLMQDTAFGVGNLLSADERNEVEKRINAIRQKGIFLGIDFDETIRPCLLRGFAMHHAGMLPQCKSFIESLGRSKLIKVCFATDTLGAGINFPFKTVVFSDFEKFNDYGFEEISVNSFKQGAGRAGRRGIDDIGYVISIPKEKNEAIIPYNKIVQESDEIKSAFKLSYGLVLSPRFLNSSVKMLNNSFDNFQNNNSADNLKTSNAMKDILKERKFIEPHNNIFRLTQKGKIASQARGINEILITELITNNVITENIKPEELASLISIFSPEKEDKIKMPDGINDRKFEQKISETMDLATSIKAQEFQKGLESDISIDTSSVPFVKLWATLSNSDDKDDNTHIWTTVVTEAISEKAVKTEGDFLKKINYTTNVLKQLQKIAPTKYLQETASKAIKMLQKSPVNDILLYELDYKENEQV